MALTSKERSRLRGEAHHLDPAVHIGQQGVTPALLQSLNDVLRARELVKIHVARQVEATPRELAGELAGQLDADVVQVIGRTATLYRENPELERRKQPSASAGRVRPR